MGATGRDDLIDQVMHGRMTPEEAEAEATRLGLGKLASEPCSDAFDPMRETWWSLPMTVAWIAWRKPDKVRAYWDKYRRECWDWCFRSWRIGLDGPVYHGFFLMQRRHANLGFMKWDETGESVSHILPHQVSAADGESKLRAVLEEGVISATGINAVTGQRLVIPQLEWQDLEMSQEHEREVFRTRERPHLKKGGYDDVLFKREVVTAMWPSTRMEQESDPGLPLIRPDGAGYMALCCAAYWIGANGGSVNFDPNDTPTWKQAFAPLLDRISSDDVAVTGVRDGVREKIWGMCSPPFLFATPSAMIHSTWFSAKTCTLMLAPTLTKSTGSADLTISLKRDGGLSGKSLWCSNRT